VSRWFRFYDDAVNDPKLLRLSDAMFRAWTMLLCIASKNNGKLPPATDIALMLRVKETKVAEWLAVLTASGLFDNDNGTSAPHNWNARQFKSDVSNDRVKRHRERKCNVTPTVTVTPSESDTETESEIYRIGEARARDRSAFTDGSKALASAFWKALGFKNPLEIPPEFAGVDWRATQWERAGWTVDLIDAEARRIAREKPLKPLSYFEKVFATSFAKRQTPLPVVEVREAEKLTVTNHGNPQNQSGVVAAARRLAEQFQSQSSDGIEGYSAPVLRLPAR
jgi:hypothetical protein